MAKIKRNNFSVWDAITQALINRFTCNKDQKKGNAIAQGTMSHIFDKALQNILTQILNFFKI